MLSFQNTTSQYKNVSLFFAGASTQAEYTDCVNNIIALSTASGATDSDLCGGFILAVEAELHSGALCEYTDFTASLN